MAGKYSSESKGAISAFAFDVGNKLEQLIIDCTDNLEARNMNLEALILGFRDQIEDKEVQKKYDTYFGISSTPNTETFFELEKKYRNGE